MLIDQFFLNAKYFQKQNLISVKYITFNGAIQLELVAFLKRRKQEYTPNPDKVKHNDKCISTRAHDDAAS